MKDIQDSSVRMLNSTDPMIMPNSIDAFDRITKIVHHVATNNLQPFSDCCDLFHCSQVLKYLQLCIDNVSCDIYHERSSYYQIVQLYVMSIICIVLYG